MKAHLDVIIIVLTHKEVSYARAGLDTNWTEMARNAMVSYIFVSSSFASLGDGCYPFFEAIFFAVRTFDICFRVRMKHSFSHILVKNL